MSFNTKVRLVFLTSAVALAAASAPVFAHDTGTWQGEFYTEVSGTPDAPAATYSKQVVNRKVAQSGVTAAGTWRDGFYTEIRGTPDAPAATYSAQVVNKKVAQSTSIKLASLSSVLAY